MVSYVAREMALGEPPMLGGGRLSVCCSTGRTRRRDEYTTNRSARTQQRVQVVQSLCQYRGWGRKLNVEDAEMDEEARCLYAAGTKSVAGL